MRNVRRLEEPQYLQKRREKWTVELIEAKKLADESGSEVKESLWKRASHPKIRKRLLEMYGRRCCYCEIPVASGHVEHRKPKSKFIELTYEWRNLHIACADCNIAKGENWSARHPILDAVVDKPISHHLSYTVDARGVRRKAITNRGGTTIKHTKMNDGDKITSAWQGVYNEASLLVQAWIKNRKLYGDSPLVEQVVDDLRLLALEAFGSVVAFAAADILE